MKGTSFFNYLLRFYRKREADVFHSKVTVDLGSMDYYNEERIRDVFVSNVQQVQKLGSHVVTLEDFNFRKFTGNVERLGPLQTVLLALVFIFILFLSPFLLLPVLS